MATQVEARPTAKRCEQPRTGGGHAAELALLGAALVTALEEALLAVHRLLGALGTAVDGHADASAHRGRDPGAPDSATGQPGDGRAVLDEVRAPQTVRPPPAYAGPPGAPVAAPGGLSRREVEVLRLLVAGQSARQIARALHLSPRTVQRHLANLYLKVGAHNKADATAYALRHGLA